MNIIGISLLIIILGINHVQKHEITTKLLAYVQKIKKKYEKLYLKKYSSKYRNIRKNHE